MRSPLIPIWPAQTCRSSAAARPRVSMRPPSPPMASAAASSIRERPACEASACSTRHGSAEMSPSVAHLVCAAGAMIRIEGVRVLWPYYERNAETSYEGHGGELPYSSMSGDSAMSFTVLEACRDHGLATCRQSREMDV